MPLIYLLLFSLFYLLSPVFPQESQEVPILRYLIPPKYLKKPCSWCNLKPEDERVGKKKFLMSDSEEAYNNALESLNQLLKIPVYTNLNMQKINEKLFKKVINRLGNWK